MACRWRRLVLSWAGLESWSKVFKTQSLNNNESLLLLCLVHLFLRVLSLLFLGGLLLGRLLGRLLSRLLLLHCLLLQVILLLVVVLQVLRQLLLLQLLRSHLSRHHFGSRVEHVQQEVNKRPHCSKHARDQHQESEQSHFSGLRVGVFAYKEENSDDWTAEQAVERNFHLLKPGKVFVDRKLLPVVFFSCLFALPVESLVLLLDNERNKWIENLVGRLLDKLLNGVGINSAIVLVDLVVWD